MIQDDGTEYKQAWMSGSKETQGRDRTDPNHTEGTLSLAAVQLFS